MILSLYLLGFVKLPDGFVKVKNYRVRFIGIFFISLSLYFASGIFGNRLSYFAAYLPPIRSTYIDISTFSRKPFFDNDVSSSLSNVKYSDILKLPTIWIPHSYASCCQHAPNEHILESITKSALKIMAGIFWDLGEPETPK